MKWWRCLLGVAFVAGIMLRLPSLDLRPMHTDEAVHAVKFGTLLETGIYRYDPNEYHGPTLNYFTIIPALLSSETTFADVTERTLRVVPVAFGIGILVLLLFIRDISRTAIAFAALLTACSPAMVFYSRYYIQEMLLVFFSFSVIVAVYRLLTTPKRYWAVLAGISAGMMAATKETWFISCGAMGISAICLILLRGRGRRVGQCVRSSDIVIAMLAAVTVSAMFYSSFFTHWQGVVDSFRAYGNYAERAGQSTLHGHPWYYFLQLLMGSSSGTRPFLTEAGVLVFALSGLWQAMRRKDTEPSIGNDLVVFLGIYALLMLAISSSIPYKTPWLVLGSLQPLLVVAGYGIMRFIEAARDRRWKLASVLLITILIVHLAGQSYLTSFKYYDDPSTPYVYSQPQRDVIRASEQLIKLVGHSPQKDSTVVQIICSGNDYWPLPWYLRSLKNVGWWNSVPAEAPPAQIILISADIEPALIRYLYEDSPAGHRPLYVPIFASPMYVRPGKEIRGFVTLDLWNKAGGAGLQ